jgi:hypothetical protein
MDRSRTQYSAAPPQPVIEEVVMTFDFPEVSFHHDAGEAPSFEEFAIGHSVQSIQGIANEHLGISDSKNCHVMVNQKTKFDERYRQSGLPQLRYVFEGAEFRHETVFAVFVLQCLGQNIGGVPVAELVQERIAILPSSPVSPSWRSAVTAAAGPQV